MSDAQFIRYEGVERGVARVVLARPDKRNAQNKAMLYEICLLYTSPSPRDRTRSRMPSSA